MKVTVHFRDAHGTCPPYNKISFIKFWRGVTDCGLKEAKDAVEAMTAGFLTGDTTMTTDQVKQYAAQSGISISISSEVLVAGTVELLRDGKVRFDLSRGEENVLKTIVPRKQAGRVLDTFIQTTEVRERMRGRHRKKS